MKIDRENTGLLFRNERKELETHSDYQGSMNIDGEEFWISAWVNTAKNGKKYLTLRFKPKQEKSNGHVVEINDEIPF